MKPASAPNLREIAQAAKVSHTTVSLALRNHPRYAYPRPHLRVPAGLPGAHR